MSEHPLRTDTRRGRVALAGLTLGSAVAILDGSVVNVALRTLGEDLGAGLAQLQWVVNGYLLALASLVLVAGALGDRFGRRRIYLLGVGLFALASIACAAAGSADQLIALRAAQGVGGALLTPGALALIQSAFAEQHRAGAIGTWAGWSGIGAAAGPFVGGWLIEHAGWRWIFAINAPLCLLVVALVLTTVPERRDPLRAGAFDVPGAALTVLCLAALTQLLTTAGQAGALRSGVLCCLTLGAATGFVLRERRAASPMVDLALFRDRVFATCNAMTLVVYGALGAVSFLTVLQLQTSAGWTPLAAGLASLPVTVALLALSSRAARLATRIGPRLPMTVGPLLCAAGVLALVGIGAGTGWLRVLPGMSVFALGLALLVSPLTATVLAAAPQRSAGLASGINNAVARAGSLLTVAALPALVGLTGTDYRDPAALTAGYRAGMLCCATLLGLGALVSWVGLRARPTSVGRAPGVASEERSIRRR